MVICLPPFSPEITVQARLFLHKKQRCKEPRQIYPQSLPRVCAVLGISIREKDKTRVKHTSWIICHMLIIVMFREHL